MNTLPEAVKAAEIIAKCITPDSPAFAKYNAEAIAAIITAEIAPLVEELDKWRIVAGTRAILLDQLQANLAAVVKAGEAAVNAYPHLVDLEEALRKAKE